MVVGACALGMGGDRPQSILIVDGTTYTVATSETSISGTPTLIGDAAKLFTIANTGKALTITTKPNAGAAFLPGEENAATIHAALKLGAAANGYDIMFLP